MELRWRVHGRVGEGVLEQLQDGECAFQETARDGRCCCVPSARSQSHASEQYGRWSCVEGCYERVLSGGDDRRAVHQGDAGWHDGNVHVSTGQYELR